MPKLQGLILKPAAVASILAVTLLGIGVRDASVEQFVRSNVALDGLTRAHPCNMEPLDFSGMILVETNVTALGPQSAVGVRVDVSPIAAEGKMSAARFYAKDIVQLAFSVNSLPATMPANFKTVFTGPRPGDGFSARISLDVTVSRDGRSLASLGNVELECAQ